MPVNVESPVTLNALRVVIPDTSKLLFASIGPVTAKIPPTVVLSVMVTSAIVEEPARIPLVIVTMPENLAFPSEAIPTPGRLFPSDGSDPTWKT